jgi:SAM-dependent methyltransferase
MSRDWNKFWNQQADPRHPKGIPDFFLTHGRELSLVVGDLAEKRVLELGCGSGSLFSTIGFDEAISYRGVDFSDSMLAAFRASYPSVDTVTADASSYCDGAKYDVIFSNAVVQYFDRRMLRDHIANAHRMLASGGKLIVGSVPWRGARASFHLQSYAPPGGRRFIRALAVLGRSYFGIDPIGHWHSYRDFHLAARAHGLTATIFGCVQYPYRFHVRMEHRT